MAPCESANFLRDWFQTERPYYNDANNPLLAQFLRHKFKSPPIKTVGTTCGLQATAIYERVSPRGWLDVVHVSRSDESRSAQGRPGDDEPALVIRPAAENMIFYIISKLFVPTGGPASDVRVGSV
jgi:hypothetical protein